jgi:arsenite/tail-anchored protein-transporting ATPase
LRVVLFAGKGGVGKTTAAAATAALAAERGARVLVVSTDPAHSLAGALGVPLTAEPTPVGGLHALRVDARARFERRWPGARGWLAELLGVPGLDGVAAGDLALPPGVAELAALLEVRDRAAAGDWDAVLLDCAPTGQLLPLLALPEELSGSLERLWPVHRRVVRTVRPAGLAGAVDSLQAALAGVRSVLASATVRLVVTPESVVVAEARRTLTALALHGYPVDSVLANRVLPAAAGDGAWARELRSAQAAALAALGPDLLVVRAAYRAAEPVGLPALRSLGAEVYGALDPIGPGPRPEAPAVSRADGGYELRVPLPHVRRADVRLARSGDDLVVSVGDQRRRLALPSVLRRCVAVGASAGDGAVRVRFRPDPKLWPAGLAP